MSNPAIDYQEGYVKAVRDLAGAYMTAKGVNSRKQTVAWLDCLAKDPERLLRGDNIDMDLFIEGKRIKAEFSVS